jgi:hypothetical protein
MIEWIKLAKRRISIVCLFTIYLLCSCKNSKTCVIETKKCYTNVCLIDEVSLDTLAIKYSFDGNKMYIINDYHYKSLGIAYELLFFDRSMRPGESLLVPESICYGKNCDSLSYPSNGYMIVMLSDQPDYYFKHIVFDATFHSNDYLDSLQTDQINNKPVLSERYYKINLSKDNIFVYYRNIPGSFDFKFGY